MHKETEHNLEQKIEEKRLRALIEKYRDRLGDFDILPVGDVGYVIQWQRFKPMAGNNWLFFDLDDTLVAYTAAKTDRLVRYCDYAASLGIVLSWEQAAKILKLTDTFSRWQENTGSKLYHADAHMLALQWATQLLSAGADVEQTILNIEAELARVKDGLSLDEEHAVSAPFSLDPETKKMRLHGIHHMWSKKIEAIFMGTTINPPAYDDVISAATRLGSPTDSIHRTNVGVFTYGDPYFQLLKTLELMDKNPELALSQIWLSKVPKGQFIAEAVRRKITADLDQEYVVPELEDYPGDSLSYGSGYILGDTPHVVIMVDDDPRQLDSILESNEFLAQSTGAQFVCIRSKRANTKMEKQTWNIVTPYGELDFTSATFSPENIDSIILINQVIGARERLGKTHPRVLVLEKMLQHLGVEVYGV